MFQSTNQMGNIILVAHFCGIVLRRSLYVFMGFSPRATYLHGQNGVWIGFCMILRVQQLDRVWWFPFRVWFFRIPAPKNHRKVLPVLNDLGQATNGPIESVIFSIEASIHGQGDKFDKYPNNKCGCVQKIQKTLSCSWDVTANIQFAGYQRPTCRFLKNM